MATAEVTVTVEDADDLSPEFDQSTYTVSIFEDSVLVGYLLNVNKETFWWDIVLGHSGGVMFMEQYSIEYSTALFCVLCKVG